MVTAKSEFENSLNLWLPDGNEVDLAQLQSLNRCQGALDQLLHGEISWSHYTDVLSTEGVEMDIYLDTALDNVESAGI